MKCEKCLSVLSGGVENRPDLYGETPLLNNTWFYIVRSVMTNDYRCV